MAQLTGEGGTVNTMYGNLDAAGRVRAIDFLHTAFREAKHDPPLPELSTPTQIWVDRIKSTMSDPDVSEESKDEMAACFYQYLAGITREEDLAVAQHVNMWCWIAENMPPDCATLGDFVLDVIVPKRAALGLEPL
jgi:hypothetical protein